MGDDRSGCRKWEENMYWSHFQSIQFLLTLSSNCDQTLALPKKFANNLREKLAAAVSLKGPSGALWNVEVSPNGDTMFFAHGWKEFVKDHSLKENDVLIFKYTGDSRFDVLMFDKESLCEKEASYFVRKCEHKEVGNGCKRKGASPENIEVTNESSHDVFEPFPLKRPRSSAVRKSKPTRQQPLTGSSKQTSRYKLSSRRRPVTIEEKEKALQMAHAASSNDSFMVIMQPSHVYKGFFMSIPLDWLKRYVPQRSRNVILRTKEGEWQVIFQRRAHNSGGLSAGWRKFVLENFLEESDVCLFKPVSRTPEAVVWDVSIFRVVDEVVPPSPVTPVPSSKGRARNVAVYLSEHLAKTN